MRRARVPGLAFPVVVYKLGNKWNTPKVTIFGESISRLTGECNSYIIFNCEQEKQESLHPAADKRSGRRGFSFGRPCLCAWPGRGRRIGLHSW